MLLTLGFGVEVGVSTDVILSIGPHLYRSSRPHIPEVGPVPGTQHFRNILCHQILIDPAVVTFRPDKSSYFANARFIEDHVFERVHSGGSVSDVVLMCFAINEIDLSAVETLEETNKRLKEVGTRLHLSEVKGPVMDRLCRAHFLSDLTGKIFQAQYDASTVLSPDAVVDDQAKPVMS